MVEIVVNKKTTHNTQFLSLVLMKQMQSFYYI